MTKEENQRLFSLSTIIIFIIFLVISFSFFIFLNIITGAGFGFVKMLYSVITALISTIILVWIKKFMIGRPYLGTIIGLLVLGLLEYGLFLKYRGPFTTGFSIIIGIFVITYLGIYFFKFRKTNLKPRDEEFNDSM